MKALGFGRDWRFPSSTDTGSPVFATTVRVSNPRPKGALLNSTIVPRRTFPARIGESRVHFVAADMPQANRLTIGIMAMVADEERR